MIESDKNTSCLKEIPALPRVTPVDSAGNYFFEIATFVNNILTVLEQNADKIPVEDLKVVKRDADNLQRWLGERYVHELFVLGIDDLAETEEFKSLVGEQAGESDLRRLCTLGAVDTDEIFRKTEDELYGQGVEMRDGLPSALRKVLVKQLDASAAAGLILPNGGRNEHDGLAM